MRVVNYVHWAGVGGAEDMTIDTMKVLRNRGVDFTFVTEEKSGESASLDEIRSLGVPIFRVGESVGNLEAVYQNIKPDVVHVFACGDVLAGYQAAINLGIQTVETVACVSYSAGWERYSDTKLIHPIYLSLKHWERGSGGKKEFRVITGGVDLDRLKVDNSQDDKVRWGLDPYRPVVGWFGRADQFKCPFSFVDIAKFIQEKMSDCQFIAFGDGVDSGRMKFLASKSGVDIRFPGFTRDKGHAFNCMDVFCFPTWQEAFGRVMVEAMAVGVPIVTADYPVCVEVCDRSAEYVEVARQDPMPREVSRKYAEKIIDLLNDEDRRNVMGWRGEERARTLFSAERMALEYLTLYKEILNVDKAST